MAVYRCVDLCRLLALAEEMLGEFIAKATGTSPSLALVEIPMPQKSSTPEGGNGHGNGASAAYQSVKVSVAPEGGPSIAARVSGLVPLAPQRAAELIKDRVAWLRECRRCDTLGGFRTPDGIGEHCDTLGGFQDARRNRWGEVGLDIPLSLF